MKKNRVNIICKICGITFEVKKCRENAPTCSRKCRAMYMIGHKPFHWKGGRFTSHGYIFILSKGHPKADRDGYVEEHRLVMEKHLGRFLDPKEVVHHKNAIRSDNRIENLELVESQSAHMKEHRRKGERYYVK